MKIKYTGRHPVHAYKMDGTPITLVKDMVVEDLRELPKEGGEYCTVYGNTQTNVPEVKVEQATNTKKKKVKQNGN